MKKRTAVKKAKSAYKLAQMLGITRQAVSKWPADAEIPQAQEVKLRELRPEWFAARPVKSRSGPLLREAGLSA